MSLFKDFLRWYNNKDVVPTLKEMQKMFAFSHDKNIDMLKLGCTLPNLANICLHKSTDAKFYPSTEGDKEKNFEKMLLVVHVSFLHAKQLLKKLFFESLQTFANLLKSIVGIDASQLHPYSMCPCLPLLTRVGISMQKRVDSHLDKTRPAALTRWSCLISNEQDQKVKFKASLQQADRRKLTASVLMGFVLIATLCLKPWVAFTTSAPNKCCVHLSLKKIFNVVARRESSMH